MPRYYIEESHKPIIAPDEWDAVQDEITRRKAIGRMYSGISVFSAKIRCGDCGGWYGPKVWHSNDPYRTRIWQCNCKFRDGKQSCSTPHLRENDIQSKFLVAYNSMLSDKKPVLEACEIIKSVLTDTAEIDSELERECQETEVVAGLIEKLVLENALSEGTEFDAKYNAYLERHGALETRQKELQLQKTDRQKKAKAIGRFIAMLRERKELLTEFDNKLWLTVVEYVTVHRDGSITFRFNSGTEVTV